MLLALSSVRLPALLMLAGQAGWGETVILQIHVLEGEGGVFPAAARAVRPLTVRVTDETGAPREGIAVTFRLPEEGVTGLFQNGLKTDLVLTAPDGKAVSPNITWGAMAGPVRIRVTAARDDARAGVLVPVYVSTLSADGGSGGGTLVAGAAIAPGAAPIRVESAGGGGGGGGGGPKLKSRKGWVRLVGIAAAAGVGGGLALAMSSRGKAASSPGAAAASAIPISIGQPTITVGQ